MEGKSKINTLLMWTRSQSDLLENVLCILERLFSSVGLNEGMCALVDFWNHFATESMRRQRGFGKAPVLHCMLKFSDTVTFKALVARGLQV